MLTIIMKTFGNPQGDWKVVRCYPDEISAQVMIGLPRVLFTLRMHTEVPYTCDGPQNSAVFKFDEYCCYRLRAIYGIFTAIYASVSSGLAP